MTLINTYLSGQNLTFDGNAALQAGVISSINSILDINYSSFSNSLAYTGGVFMLEQQS